MTIITSPSYVPTEVSVPGINAPFIGYHNLVNVNNVLADVEDPDFPVTNVANPATAFRWVGDLLTIDQYLTVTTNYVPAIDYIAIARHNLGSAGIPITIEGDAGAGFTELVPAQLLGDDSPALFRWSPASMQQVRMQLGQGSEAPTIATVYLGKLLYLQRNIYVGHTPINYGRTFNIATGVSENGQYLGEVIIGEGRANSLSLKNLTAIWYRQYLDLFIRQRGIPFFFGWRPETYPNEIGYCWIKGNPKPTNQLANGMMGIEVQLEGVA